MLSIYMCKGKGGNPVGEKKGGLNPGPPGHRKEEEKKEGKGSKLVGQ